MQPHRRRRQLFANDPLTGIMTELGRMILEHSVRDLEHREERAECGIGIFIDRPFGYAKAPARADQTPLLAYEAFSPSIARRWQDLLRLCDELRVPMDRDALQVLFENGPWPTGLPHGEVAECPRPTAALCDVRKVADDFVIVLSARFGLIALCNRFALVQTLQGRFRLAFLQEREIRLLVQVADGVNPPALALYDDRLGALSCWSMRPKDSPRELDASIQRRGCACNRFGKRRTILMYSGGRSRPIWSWTSRPHRIPPSGRRRAHRGGLIESEAARRTMAQKQHAVCRLAAGNVQLTSPSPFASQSEGCQSSVSAIRLGRYSRVKRDPDRAWASAR